MPRNSTKYGVLQSAILAVISLLAACPLAFAQTQDCIKTYLVEKTKPATGFGITPERIQKLVAKIADSLPLDASRITIVECRWEPNASAQYIAPGHPDIPAGEYLIYKNRWFQEVTGDDEWQVIAVLAHELAHFLNRDWMAAGTDVDRKKIEARADYFAGCSLGRLKGDWVKLESLLERLRDEKTAKHYDPRYPDRLTSITEAKRGFDQCSLSGQSRNSGKRDEETRAFQEIEVLGTIEGFLRYLSKFPMGKYVFEATAGIRELSAYTHVQPPRFIVFDDGRAFVGAEGDKNVRLMTSDFTNLKASLIVVIGRDNSDIDEVALDIGLRRATAVKNALVKRGIPAGAIIAVSLGSTPSIEAGYYGVDDMRRAEMYLIKAP